MHLYSIPFRRDRNPVGPISLIALVIMAFLRTYFESTRLPTFFGCFSSLLFLVGGVLQVTVVDNNAGILEAGT